MPRTGYMVLANSGSIDMASQNLSMFEIIDTIKVFNRFQAQMPENIPGGFRKLKLVTTWTKEDQDDPNIKYECQIVCVGPDGMDIISINYPPIFFNQTFVKLFADVALTFNVLGMHTLEARLRRDGETEWSLRQTYPFLVENMPIVQPPDIAIAHPEPATPLAPSP